MNIDNIIEQDFANAISQRTCPDSPTETDYFKANKDKISLPSSDVKYPKYVCDSSDFPS